MAWMFDADREANYIADRLIERFEDKHSVTLTESQWETIASNAVWELEGAVAQIYAEFMKAAGAVASERTGECGA